MSKGESVGDAMIDWPVLLSILGLVATAFVVFLWDLT